MRSINSHPFKNLYDFVREHLTIVNSIIAASGSIVAIFDFLTPRLSILPTLVYSLTAIISVAMIFAACSSSFAARVSTLLGIRLPKNGVSLWHWPGWQFALTILIGVTVIGFASIAKASDGGVIASAIPEVKKFQEMLLSMKADMSEIKSGVGEVNKKIDKISVFVDPTNPADRCPDLECAVQDNASPDAIKRLIAKGARLSGIPAIDGSLLLHAALTLGPGRFEVLDMLSQQGLDKSMLLTPIILEPSQLTKAARLVVTSIKDATNMDESPTMKSHIFPSSGDPELDAWNFISGCFKLTSGGVALIEVASLFGDGDLVHYLRNRGIEPPSRRLKCDWRVPGKSGSVQINFDPISAKYVGLSQQHFNKILSTRTNK